MPNKNTPNKIDAAPVWCNYREGSEPERGEPDRRRVIHISTGRGAYEALVRKIDDGYFYSVVSERGTRVEQGTAASCTAAKNKAGRWLRKSKVDANIEKAELAELEKLNAADQAIRAAVADRKAADQLAEHSTLYTSTPSDDVEQYSPKNSQPVRDGKG